MLEGKQPLPPLSVDHIPDPTIEELVAWMNEWDDGGVRDRR